jgi:hypothetical protein
MRGIRKIQTLERSRTPDTKSSKYGPIINVVLGMSRQGS